MTTLKDIVSKVNKAFSEIAEMAHYPIGDENLRGFDEASPQKIIIKKI